MKSIFQTPGLLVSWPHFHQWSSDALISIWVITRGQSHFLNQGIWCYEAEKKKLSGKRFCLKTIHELKLVLSSKTYLLLNLLKQRWKRSARKAGKQVKKSEWRLWWWWGGYRSKVSTPQWYLLCQRGSHDPVSGGSGVSERRLTDKPERDASCVPSHLDLSSFLPSLSLFLLRDPPFSSLSQYPLHSPQWLSAYRAPALSSPRPSPFPFSTHLLFHPLS